MPLSAEPSVDLSCAELCIEPSSAERTGIEPPRPSCAEQSIEPSSAEPTGVEPSDEPSSDEPSSAKPRAELPMPLSAEPSVDLSCAELSIEPSSAEPSVDLSCAEHSIEPSSAEPTGVAPLP